VVGQRDGLDQRPSKVSARQRTFRRPEEGQPGPRIWRDNDLKPWKQQTFKFSTDPELDAKVRDVVGLYLNPPARVRCAPSA
jgi:hypothetical protein